VKLRRPPRRLLPEAPWLVLAGLEAGVAGGAASLLYLMLDGMLGGAGPWFYLNLAAANLSEGAAGSSASFAALTGAGLHILACGLFGLLAPPVLIPFVRRPVRSALVGCLLGLCWYYVSFRYIWPQVSPALVVFQPFPGVLIAYLLLGFIVGLYPRFAARLSGIPHAVPDSPFL